MNTYAQIEKASDLTSNIFKTTLNIRNYLS